MPVNKFLEVKVNGIICDIRVMEEITEGVIRKEYEQIQTKNTTESNEDNKEEFFIASKVSGNRDMMFVSEEVDGEEKTVSGKMDRGGEAVKAMERCETEEAMKGCEDLNGCMEAEDSRQ